MCGGGTETRKKAVSSIYNSPISTYPPRTILKTIEGLMVTHLKLPAMRTHQNKTFDRSSAYHRLRHPEACTVHYSLKFQGVKDHSQTISNLEKFYSTLPAKGVTVLLCSGGGKKTTMSTVQVGSQLASADLVALLTIASAFLACLLTPRHLQCCVSLFRGFSFVHKQRL